MGYIESQRSISLKKEKTYLECNCVITHVKTSNAYKKSFHQIIQLFSNLYIYLRNFGDKL